MKIIVASGKSGSGKDEFYRIAKDLIATPMYRLAFADDIKSFCQGYFGWNGVKDEQGRDLLIAVGEAGRTYSKNLWIDRVIDKIHRLPDDSTVIITDARFPREITRLQSCLSNVTTIRIERPEWTNGLTVEQLSAEPETALDDFEFDYVIVNDGTLESFAAKCQQMLDNTMKTEE